MLAYIEKKTLAL